MFKNARLYVLEDPASIDAAELEQKLGGRRFRPCGPIETMTMGWTAPLGDGTEALAHAANGCVLVCARRQERLLPAAVVAEALDERVAEVEEREARTLGRAERRRMREEVLLEMLPRAFTRSRQVRAYLDTAAGWLLVDAATEKAAEELIGLLRETLGSLPVTPPRPGVAPAALMTRWVTEGRGEEGLDLADECELRDPRDERAVVRWRGQDLGGEEMAAHLRAGKQVVKLALDWQERLSFLLQDDVSLKRLRFADELIEEAVEADIEDEAARFDAEFAIMALEMRELLGRLNDLLAIGREA